MRSMDALVDDLVAETEALDAVVDDLDDLTVPTPAPGWTVADQLSHLWFFDRQALLAIDDPDAFRAGVEALLAARTDPSVELGRSAPPDELLDAWHHERGRLVERARTLDPATRIPWYGPSMGARSFITARLMETWAHGQDVVDAVGATRPSTARLRHVAHIGVTARPFAFRVHGREPPAADVRVELAAPDGDAWTWGPDGAADAVRGPALDFCLLVTQRRHRDDVDLVAEGPVADEWLSVAQAFAGPPGPGREPGQFR